MHDTATEQLTSTSIRSQTICVLLVEDNPADARLVLRYLEKQSTVPFELETRASLQGALEILKTRSFDLILLDHYLPDSEGLDSLKKIQNIVAHTPIVFLSGKDSQDEEFEAVASGAQDYLIKGHVNAGTLKRVIMHAIHRQKVLGKLTMERERIEHDAHHDALTGLPNRLLFNERLERAITAGQRSGQLFAVLFIDLDGFKDVNDTLGHEAGDTVLQTVAERLCYCVRESDTVSRQGGDEFIVLLLDVKGPKNALDVAEKILALVRRPVQIGHQQAAVSASIGIAMFPEDGTEAAVLLKRADQAMYRGKKDGKNTVQIFDAGTGQHIVRARSRTVDLAKALSGKKMKLFYQPQIDLTTNHVAAHEALVRWPSARRGMRMPKEFLGVASEAGLARSLERWVLREACRQNQRWRDTGQYDIPVMVNISAACLQDERFTEDVFDALTNAGLPPEKLGIEIAEGDLIAASAVALENLKSVKSKGVLVALDGFGKSVSHLRKLFDLKIDIVKLDASCVRGIPASFTQSRYTLALLGLGKQVGARVLAQGVETADQAAFVSRQGFDNAQGYFFAFPCPANRLTASSGVTD